MHPVLFHLGGVPVTAYGVALSLAFAVGIVVARRRAAARGIDPEIIVEASLVILLTSLVGSRLLFAIEQPQLFRPPAGSWATFFSPFLKTGSPAERAGLAMSGGVVLAAACTLVLLRLRGAPILRVTDVLAPSVALGEGITRIGCFLNGCCHGVACDLPWAVAFPPGSPAWKAFGEAAVHPTQLYASLAGFATFALLVRLAGSTWARARPGAVFFAFLALWGATRVLIDLVRAYPSRPEIAIAPWQPHQPLVATLLAVGVAGLAWLCASGRGRESRG